jgi:DNA-binding GntR family transcriptional regulator
MTPSLSGRVPQYAQIAQQLLEDITSGHYPDNSLLPAEPELCRMFGVSRVTVRGAMRELELRGVIVRRSGIGTRVRTAALRDRFVHESSTVEDIIRFTADLKFEILSAGNVVADAALVQRLGCRPDETFVRVEGLRRSQETGQPVCLSVHYTPAAYAAIVPRFDGMVGSLAAALARQFGETVDEVHQVIEAENLNASEARLLAARKRDAAIVTRRWYRSGAGRLLLASRSMFPKDRYSYALTSRRAPVLPVHSRPIRA